MKDIYENMSIVEFAKKTSLKKESIFERVSEKIKRELKRGKRFVVKRIALVALATTMIASASAQTASAASSEKPTIESQLVIDKDVFAMNYISNPANDMKYSDIKTNYSENMRVNLKVPYIKISYSDSAQTKPSGKSNETKDFTISKINLEICQNVKDEIDYLFDKLDAAVKKGNYTQNKTALSVDAVLVSLHGDMNLIKESISAKYKGNSEVLEFISYYITNNRERALVYEVYNSNSKGIEYYKLRDFSTYNYAKRVEEKNGNVKYTLNTGAYTVKDNGYVTTSSITAAPPTKLNSTIWENTYFGYNLYVDNQLSGGVSPMARNDKMFLPVRYVANMCGYEVSYDSATQAVVLYRKTLPTEDIKVTGTNRITQSIIYPNITAHPTGTLNATIEKKSCVVYTGAPLFINDGKKTSRLTYNGKELETYSIDGVMYCEARAVSESLLSAYIGEFDTDIISYDGVTFTVHINRPGQYKNNPNQLDYDSGLFLETPNGNINMPPEEQGNINWGDMSPESGPHYRDHNGNLIDTDDYIPYEGFEDYKNR